MPYNLQAVVLYPNPKTPATRRRRLEVKAVKVTKLVTIYHEVQIYLYFFICFFDRVCDAKMATWRYALALFIRVDWNAAFSVQLNVKKAANLQLIRITLSKEIVLLHLEFKWSFASCLFHWVHSVNRKVISSIFDHLGYSTFYLMLLKEIWIHLCRM